MIKIKNNNKNAFTLVELLAVIVILAIILVIAVPKVMSVIEDAKKATLESTAKMIASAAEKAKVQNTVLGKTEEITCESVAKINDVDYSSCSITFDNNKALVTINGSNKFDGLSVCKGTKTESKAQKEKCKLENDDNQNGNDVSDKNEVVVDFCIFCGMHLDECEGHIPSSGETTLFHVVAAAQNSGWNSLNVQSLSNFLVFNEDEFTSDDYSDMARTFYMTAQEVYAKYIVSMFPGKTPGSLTEEERYRLSNALSSEDKNAIIAGYISLANSLGAKIEVSYDAEGYPVMYWEMRS